MKNLPLGHRPHYLGWIVAVFVGLISQISFAADPIKKLWYGHRLVQVEIAKQADIAIIESLSARVLNEFRGESPMLVLADTIALDTIVGLGFSTIIIHEDMGRIIDRERYRLSLRDRERVRESNRGDDWFADYKDLEEISDYLDDLVRDHPDRAQIIQVGETIEGRVIQGIRIGSDDDSPSLTFSATQHAREWIAAMTAMCFIDQMVRNSDQHDLYEKAISDLNVYIFPVVNPDGYVETWTGDRLWRKNKNGRNGVDLNRNWGTGWGLVPGSSGNPFAEDYRGESAFSERETTGIRNLILGLDHHIAHFDYHNYSQLIIYPFGFPRELAVTDAENRKLAAAMASAISDVHRKTYEPIRGRDFLAHAGIVADWVAGDLERVALSIELRPQEANFILPPSEILPTCEENLAGLDTILRWALGEKDGDTGGESDSGDTKDLSDSSDSFTDVASASASDSSVTSKNDSSLNSGESGCACNGIGHRDVSQHGWLWIGWLFLVLTRIRSSVFG